MNNLSIMKKIETLFEDFIRAVLALDE